MWPFTKKKTEPKPDVHQEAFDKLREFRGIGERFNYLGVEMVVTGHCELMPGLYGPELWPTLKADYVNKHGEVKSISFAPREINTLIAENT